jgi:hypothetical protein
VCSTATERRCLLRLAAWVGGAFTTRGGSVRVAGHWTRAACGQICGGVTQPEAIVQTARLTVHGHRITYREADDARDPVLLLVHGITSSSANSDPVIPAFTERTHLLAPNLLNPLQKPSTIDFKIHKY